jgi:hypothetical protein
MQQFKLGKKPARRLLTTPSLGDFLPRAAQWPAVKPRGWEYAKGITLGMLGNGPDPSNPPSAPNGVGNCVIAAAMHYAQIETANTQNPLTPTTALALKVYSTITGYDPSQTDASGNNPTDQGTDFQSQLFPFWKSTGLPMLDRNGKEVLHTILGYADLDLGSVAQQRYALDLFGGKLTGINCPQSALDDTSNWTYDPSSPIAGGHGITEPGQGAAGWHTISWGLSIPGTWEFSAALADEMYIVVTPFWLGAQQVSPSGLDLNGLLAAMAAL